MPFDPSGTRRSSVVDRRRRAGRHGRAGASGPATATDDRPAAPGARWWSPTGRGDGRWPRDFYEVLGVPRTRAPDEIQRRTGSWPARYHPDVNKDPGAEERFKEITEAYDVLSDPETRRRYDRFGARLPPGARGRTMRSGGRGPARRGSGGRRRVRCAGPRRAGSERSGSRRSATGSTSRTCSAACSAAGAAGRARSPAPTRRPSSTLTRRGGVPRRPALDHPGRAGGTAQLRREHPGRGHRRPADPARRAGRRGARRPGAGDLYLVVRHRAAPAVPGRGPRHPRRPAAGAMGGGARRHRRRSTRPAARPRSRPAGHVERPPAAAARPGHAQPARPAGRPVRRGQDHGAGDADATRSGGCSRSWPTVSTFDPQEAAMTDDRPIR